MSAATPEPRVADTAPAGVRRAVWVAWLLVMGLGAAAYSLGGVIGADWLHGSLAFNLLGGAAVVALILGGRANWPKRRLPWQLLAIGQVMFVISDVLASNYERLFGSPLPFPSVADSFHLAFYPFLVGGMLLLIHERDESRDRSALIDALIVTMALATLLWVYLIAPYARADSMNLLTRMASIGYPAMDILVLGVVARMAAGSHRREPSFIFLLTGAAILLASDTIFGARLLEGRFHPGAATSAGWAAFYVMLGASALHPSMRQLSEPGAQSESGLTRARLALLACASMTVPLLIVLRRALHEPVDIYVLIGASAVMFALVLMRMAGIMRRHEEVTEREAALRVALTEREVTARSEARMGALIKNSSDVVCVLGADTLVQYVSPSLRQMFAHDPEQITERELTELIHPDDRGRVRALIASIAAGPPAQRSVAEFRISHGEEGSWCDVEALGTNLLADETIAGIVLNIRDVSERKAFEDELEHQAFHDTLTGLPNRALFRNRVEHSLASRRRDHLPVAVLFLDIDDFKLINDSLGHAAGDELLQEIGRRLEDCMRPVDTAARLGGDEFAILIRDSESELQSVEIAQRVMACVAAPIALEARDVSVAVSLGIAFSDQNMVSTRDAEELLRNADAAMYMAKESGKGGYQLFNPEMHQRAMARLELKGELQRALEDGEFTLRYQPIMDLARGDMAGMEALARWDHPEKGLLSPIDFVPLLEETGLIVGVGHDILAEACNWAARMQQECPREPPMSMAVNVSARQLQRPEFISEVAQVVEQSGIVPSSLTLELTESVMMQDMEVSLLRLEALRRLGVKLAIDDFGTGYSSLNYVRELPVDILKIDRSFLADTNPQVAEMTASIVELARIFNLKAVAEGVENPEQLERLQVMHCDFGQGFHFAEPLPAAEILELVNTQRADGGSALHGRQRDAPVSAAVPLSDS